MKQCAGMLKSAASTLALMLAAILGLMVSNAEGGQSIRGADPSVLRIDTTYISVQSLNGGIAVRQASSPDALASVTPNKSGLIPRVEARSGHRRSPPTAVAIIFTSRPV